MDLFRKKNNTKKYKERIEKVFREFNEKIPEMNKNIIILKKKRIELSEALNKHTDEKEKIIKLKEKIAATNEIKQVELLNKKIAVINETIYNDTRELNQSEKNYRDALSGLKSFLNVNQKIVENSIHRINQEEKQEWMDKCNNIMSQFSFNTDYESINETSCDKNPIYQKIKDGLNKIEEIEILSKNLKNKALQKKITNIIKLSYQVIDDIKIKPDHLTARRFLVYYLDAIKTIIEKTVILTNKNLTSPEISNAIKKINNILTTTHKALKKMHIKMMESDIMFLDAEIIVLEQTLKTEGLD